MDKKIKHNKKSEKTLVTEEASNHDEKDNRGILCATSLFKIVVDSICKHFSSCTCHRQKGS